MELSIPVLSHHVKSNVARWFLILALVLTALGWWAFANPPQSTPAGSDAWSKGVYAGTASLNQAAAVQVGPQGVYLVWVDEANRLHFANVDDQGQLKTDRFLAIATLFPRSPQLLLDADDLLHLAWLDGQGTQQLYYTRVDRSGHNLAEPVMVSAQEEAVSAFQMAFNERGRLEMFWSNDEGLLHTTLDEEGRPLRSPRLLWPGGDDPSLQVDKEGLFHLIFTEPFGSLNRRIFYTTFDPAAASFGEPLQITDIFRRGGQLLEGPALGLDNENAYIFWSLVDSRDVTSFAFYATFPLDDPQPASPKSLNVTGGDFPSGLHPLDGQRSQMIVALSTQVLARGEREFQILTGVFTGGRYRGHQLVSASRSPSLKPTLAADKEGNLHGVWLDAGRLKAYRVVYASTMPRFKEALSGFSFYAVVDNLFSGILGLAFVVGVMPFLIVWGVVPLTIILVYVFATGQDLLTRPGTWTILGLACLTQILIMIFLSPDNRFLSAFWQIGLPILLAAPAGLVIYFFAARWKMQSLFVALFLFIFTHGLLRLIIFALLFSGGR